MNQPYSQRRTRKVPHIVAVSLAGLFLLMPRLATPQIMGDTASIYGSVRDTTNASVPGAGVEIRNLQTGLTRSTVTTQTGDFAIANIPAGTYALVVRLNGFKTFTREGITVQVDQRAMVNPVLEVGDLTEQVTVRVETPLIETSRATLKALLDHKRVSELPLQGRNLLDLTLLAPGTQPTTSAFISQVYTAPNQVFISASGSRGNMTSYNLDGVDNSDTYTNASNSYPNPDAVEALSIETNSFSAEYGRRSGAVVNAITRAGTNEFHGSAFEFARDYHLNAANFFTPGTPDYLKRHQFGGSVGGPIIRNKTFFFAAYQRTTSRRNSSLETVVLPTAAMRAGDFSELRRTDGSLIVVRDPVSGQPFPNNRVPVDRLDPIAAGVLQHIPTPSDPSGRFIVTRPNISTDDQIVARVDHMFSPANRLTGRVIWGNTDSGAPIDPANILTAGFQVDFKSYNVSIQDTHAFTPRLLGVFSATLNRLWSASGADYPTTFRELGANIVDLSLRKNLEVVIPAYFSLPRLDPVVLVRNNFQYQGALSYVTGAHEMKFGADVIRQQFDVPLAALVSNGLFIFGNEFTGSNLTDFMMGRASLFIQSTGWSEALRTTQAGFYFQDRFKVSPRFTLDAGIRYEPYVPWVDSAHKATAKWIPGKQSTRSPGLPPGVILAGEQGVPDGGHEGSWKRFAPRVGFAYVLPNDTTSIRGGYGLFYDFPNAVINNRFASAVPFVVRIDIPNPPSLQNPFTPGQPNPFPVEVPVPSGFVFPRPVTAVTYGDNFTNGHLQQWNLTVEHQFAADWLFRASYVGSKGSSLMALNELNPARFVPGQSTLQNVDQRRIYAPDFASVQSLEANGRSWYNALTVGFEKKHRRGYSMSASYTFGRSTDYQSNIVSHGQNTYTNPFDLTYDHGPSDFDHTHRVVGMFMVELPSPANAPAALRHIIGHWQLNCIFMLQSGAPLTVFAGSDRSLDGVGGDRPDLIGDPNLSSDRPTAEKVRAWFNTAAFVLNQPGTYGTAGRNILRGPGLAKVDLSLFKNIPFMGRYNVQIRAEAFNVFNRVNFNNPVTTFSSPLFGRIGSAADARVLQLGLRMTF